MNQHLRLANLLTLGAWVLLSMNAGHSQVTTSTIASRGSINRSASTFVESLTDAQTSHILHTMNDRARTDWHYVPKTKRKGLSLKEMHPPQRELAMKVLENALSAAGFEKAKLVMAQEEIIRHFENGSLRDPQLYYWTLFGQPGRDGKWGLSVEGHHLSCNLVITGNRITCATPLFIGANPARVLDNGGVGPPVGTHMLKKEEELGFALLESLTSSSRETAHVAEKSPFDMHEAQKAQTELLGRDGIQGSDMPQESRKLLEQLCEVVVNNATQEVAEPAMDHVRSEINQIRFAWYGGTKPGEPYSWQIQGPSILILLYKTQSDSAGNPSNHTHLLWRSPGRDFGM